MINHDLKCIFIHIPRCAGTSVEYWLCGKDWWSIDPASKHLTARQARNLYAEYWGRYFKFSIVRNPVARSLSCLKYADHFGLSACGGTIDFSGYHARFGSSIVVEHDYRFHTENDVRHPGQKPGQVYANILDEPLDFVARFETLDQDMERIRAELGLTQRMKIHAEQSTEPSIRPNQSTEAKILAMYKEDYRIFRY